MKLKKRNSLQFSTRASLSLVSKALIRPVGHLLPSFGREKAKPFEIIAFSRAARMGEGGRQAG
jgi:hypothetical protein